MTVLDDFYEAYFHYTVDQRLFEDTCRQLRDCRGTMEERQALVDETLRLAMCVSDDIDDTEGLIGDVIEYLQTATDGPDILEELALVNNNLKEDRARANSYSNYVTYRRIGNRDRKPRKPQIANPFEPILEDETEEIPLDETEDDLDDVSDDAFDDSEPKSEKPIPDEEDDSEPVVEEEIDLDAVPDPSTDEGEDSEEADGDDSDSEEEDDSEPVVEEEINLDAVPDPSTDEGEDSEDGEEDSEEVDDDHVADPEIPLDEENPLVAEAKKKIDELRRNGE